MACVFLEVMCAYALAVVTSSEYSTNVHGRDGVHGIAANRS